MQKLDSVGTPAAVGPASGIRSMGFFAAFRRRKRPTAADAAAEIAPAPIRHLPQAVLVLGVALSVVGTAQVRQLLLQEHLQLEQTLLNEVRDAIREKFALNTALLSSVNGLFQASDPVERRQFTRFEAALASGDGGLRGIQGIGFARSLRGPELLAFEARVRAEGFPSFRVTPPGVRPRHGVIDFLEPFDWRNRRAFGFDLYSDPVRRAAMARAARTGEASLSGPVRLLQETETDVQPGVLLFLPVYRAEASPLAGAGSGRQLLGWAYSPLRTGDLITAALESVNATALGSSRVLVYDGSSRSPATLLFDSLPGQRARAGGGSPGHAAVATLELAGRPWTVALELNARGNPPSWIPPEVWRVLLPGLAISSLLAVVVHGLVESYLATRRALASNEEAMKKQALANTVFEASSLAIVVANPEGTILRANTAFTQLSGYRSREVVGQRTNLLKSGRHDASFYRVMWDALLSRDFWEGDVWNRVRSGELRRHHLAISRVADERQNTRYFVGMLEDVTDRHAAEEAVRYQALHDPLTGLANRSLLMEHLEREVARCRRHGGGFGVLYIDLDGFKPVNDRLGHAAGDALLMQVAQRLRSTARESDVSCRQGGDEFVVLVPQASSDRELEILAFKLLATLQQPFTVEGSTEAINASIGIARFPIHGDSADELLKAADAAMYRAKGVGGARVGVAEPKHRFRPDPPGASRSPPSAAGNRPGR